MNLLEPKPPDLWPFASSYLPKYFSCSSMAIIGQQSSFLSAPSPWADLSVPVIAAQVGYSRLAWGLPFNQWVLFALHCRNRSGLAIDLSIGDLGSEVFEALSIWWLIPLADLDLCVCQVCGLMLHSIFLLFSSFWSFLVNPSSWLVTGIALMALCFGISHCSVSVDCLWNICLYLCSGLKLEMDSPCGVSLLTMPLVVSNCLSNVAFLLDPSWLSMSLLLFCRRPLLSSLSFCGRFYIAAKLNFNLHLNMVVDWRFFGIGLYGVLCLNIKDAGSNSAHPGGFLFGYWFCCWNLIWARSYRVLYAISCFQLKKPQYLVGLSTSYVVDLLALRLSETTLKPLVHAWAPTPASFAQQECLFSFPSGSGYFLICYSSLANFHHVHISFLGQTTESLTSNMVISLDPFDFFQHASLIGSHCQYLFFSVQCPCILVFVKLRMLLCPKVCYVSVVGFLRNSIIRTYLASGAAFPFMMLDEPNVICVISKRFLSRLVSCLSCLFIVQAVPKLFTWRPRCDHLDSRCWVGPKDTRQSQVRSSSCSMASWIHPLLSREYSCGSHGNMLRLHGHVLDLCGFRLEFLLDTVSYGLWPEVIEAELLMALTKQSSCGFLVMICSYSFGFVRCFHALACMIIVAHSMGCILVILHCRFVNRPLSLIWRALYLQLIRVCKPLTMELSQFGSSTLLTYDLNIWGLLCVTYGTYVTCSIEFQHWTIVGTVRAVCCFAVQYLL